jgi:hypothetical protein
MGVALFSGSGLAGTYNGITTTLAATAFPSAVTYAASLTAPIVITASPMTGYNFPRQPVDGLAGGGGSPSDGGKNGSETHNGSNDQTCAPSSSNLAPGVIAGLAITSILAAVGVIALFYGSLMLYQNKKARRYQASTQMACGPQGYMQKPTPTTLTSAVDPGYGNELHEFQPHVTPPAAVPTNAYAQQFPDMQHELPTHRDHAWTSRELGH